LHRSQFTYDRGQLAPADITDIQEFLVGL